MVTAEIHEIYIGKLVIFIKWCKRQTCFIYHVVIAKTVSLQVECVFVILH